MPALLAVLLTAMITDNFVVSKFMGICPFLGVSKKLDSALGMGAAVVFVMVCSTLVTWPFYTFVLLPLGLGYLYNIGFILIIALFVQLIEIVMRKKLPALHKALGVYLPLITTNCAVLGVCLLNIDNGLSFASSIVNALGGGLGFTLLLVIFSGVRGRIKNNDIPETFKGVPATLVAAAIVSISFMGFSGLIK